MSPVPVIARERSDRGNPDRIVFTFWIASLTLAMTIWGKTKFVNLLHRLASRDFVYRSALCRRADFFFHLFGELGIIL